MNLFISIFLIIISVGTFFMYIDPTYKGTAEEKGIKQLLVIKDSFNTKKANAAKINKLKANLNVKYNLIATDDLKKIKKMLPDHMDNVKLIVDIQRIGYDSQNNIRLGDISLFKKGTEKSNQTGEIEIVGKKGYDSVVLNFSFTSNYAAFKRFIEDLRKSLRLVDIVDISITQNENSSGNDISRLDNYKFSISLRTYWMNDNYL